MPVATAVSSGGWMRLPSRTRWLVQGQGDRLGTEGGLLCLGARRAAVAGAPERRWQAGTRFNRHGVSSLKIKDLWLLRQPATYPSPLARWRAQRPLPLAQDLP